MADKGGKEGDASGTSAPVSRMESLLPPSDGAPPSYVEGAGNNGQVPAGTLLLAGTTTYNADSASTPPLYELTYPVGHLRESNTNVLFYRYDHHVCSTSGETSAPGPQVASRKRHIFDLRRDPTVTDPPFPYRLESVSRGKIGHVGLNMYRRLTSTGARAWRCTRPREGADLDAKEMVFVTKSRGQGRNEWRDDVDDKQILADETMENGIYKLQVVVPMPREKRDALVATWCLRLWWEVALSKVEPLSWAEVKNVLQYHTKEFPVGTGAGW